LLKNTTHAIADALQLLIDWNNIDNFPKIQLT